MPEEKQASRIMLVDDHPIVRDGLRQMIERDAALVVCGEAGGAEEALAGIETAHPDLLTVDVFLDGMNGIELTKILLERDPDIRILVLSMHDENLYAERALRAGARGYVMKQEASREILRAIHTVLEGGVYVSERLHGVIEGVPRKVAANGDLSQLESLLSSRELSVLRALGEGLDRNEVAKALKISAKTVETHRANIKNKLSIARSTDLADVARSWLASRGKNGVGS